MDNGGDGVCKTCYEENAIRATDSATRQDSAVDANVARCNYCRAAEDDVTTIDAEGYCDACRALSRCILHEELIAVGHCKTCRREFCRKCLGFTDVCQECTTKAKTKPLKEKAPSAAAAAKPSKSPKKAKKTAPMEEPAARGAPKGAKTGTKNLKGGKGSKPLEEDVPAAKKPKKPSRGQAAIQEKLEKKSTGRSRTQVIAAASILALGILIMVSGMWMHAMSPEEQARKLKEQMITVHRGVVHHYRKNGRLPKNADDIRMALTDLKVRNASKIKISLKSAEPGAVIYVPGQSGFMVQGADSKGELLKSAAGVPFYFDQYYDSSAL